MNIIEFQNVNHFYGKQQVIKAVSLSFRENKTTAIIGRSGSGKSTLLQFVNGLIKPSSGSVFLFGEKLNYDNVSSLRLKMGYMVQGTGLFPHLTIEDNISIAGKLTFPKAHSTERINHLMDLVGLPLSLKSKYPFQLSGGEQQRTGVCRALFLNPPLLLMDEPFGALDPITREDIQKEILTVQKNEPRTILLVTHDMREAKKLADYILVIDEGEVQQFDKASQVLAQPANEIVKRLINASLA